MHAILCSWFDDVKVLPLHEVERAAAVEVIRYGYPFIRVRWVFDLAVRFANRTSDPCGGFLRETPVDTDPRALYRRKG